MVDVSVIICTRNRAGFIEDCLDSVANSIRFLNKNKTCEIVVVNNKSTDDTQIVLERWTLRNPDVFLSVIIEKRLGLSNARNAGVASSKGNLIVFTDDDCRLDISYLSKLIELDEQDLDSIIRGGRIELGCKDDLPLTIKTSREIECWSRTEKSARKKRISGLISGANMAMRRMIIQEIGDFDILLGAGSNIPGSEDTDYLCRAYIKDIKIEYNPNLIVHHFHGRRCKKSANQLLKNYAIGAGAVYLKYIATEFDLFRPFIWNFKLALKEISTFKNLYVPEYNISYCTLLFCNILGMIRYISQKIIFRL
jgi:glycosyltransferase involved in cell wall biosynthesis